MPHLTLEYSAPLPLAVDIPAVLAGLHRVLDASGEFQLPQVKSRAVPLATTLVGDGGRPGVFVHLTVAILSGRDAACRRRLSEACLGELRGHFDPLYQRYPCDLTVEIREMARESYAKAMNDLAR